MKKILLVAATDAEISPLLRHFKVDKEPILNPIEINHDGFSLTILITGVGMVNTTYQVTKYLSNFRPHIALNAGIAGSFSDKFGKGSVVRVCEDFFSEMGAEDGENFISIDELGLGFSKVEDKTSNQISTPALFRTPFVRAITVNRVNGNEKSIQAVLSRLQPEIETMEGAAFSLVCKKEGIPFIHVRSISNKVERRNRSEWNVPLAIENLNQFLLQLIPELS